MKKNYSQYPYRWCLGNPSFATSALARPSMILRILRTDPRVLTREYNTAFQQATGSRTRVRTSMVRQSHGGSGSQARSVN